MPSMLYNAWKLATHRLHYSVIAPLRGWQLRRVTKPFWHRSVKGLWFLIDPVDYISIHIFKNGIYEEKFLSFLERHLSRRGVMLDIGANVGNHSLYLHDTFKNVYAFEPNPVALEKLKLHIAKNSLENITTFPVGLSDVAETLSFESPPSTNLGMGRFLRTDQEIPGTTKVLQLRTEIGDRILLDHGIEGVDFIKIDVEGFEIEVMRGLRNTIQRDKPVIAFEWHGRARSQEEFSQIRDMLVGYKYFEMPEWAPEEMTLLEKLMFRLRYGYENKLVPVNQPEHRTYWQLIALAGEGDLRD